MSQISSVVCSEVDWVIFTKLMINVLATFTVITTGNTLQWSLYHSQSLLYWSLYHSQSLLYWHTSLITILARFTNDHCTDNIHSDHWTGIHNDHCADNTLVITVLIHSDHCTDNIHSDHCTDNFHSDHCTDNIHSDHWTGNIHSDQCTSHFIVITVLTTYAFTIAFAYLLSCRLWKESKREKREVTSSPQSNENVSVITGVVVFYLLCVCIMCCKSSYLFQGYSSF